MKLLGAYDHPDDVSNTASINIRINGHLWSMDEGAGELEMLSDAMEEQVAVGSDIGRFLDAGNRIL